MTEQNEPPRAIIDEDDLEPAVDELLALGRQRGMYFRELRPEVGALREEIRRMDTVALLEDAYEALANTPRDIGDELKRLRWEAFGRLVEKITVASGATQMEAVDQLREFVFTEALGRPAADLDQRMEQRHGIGELLREQLRRRLSSGA
jgi:hypothetical protein